MVGLQNPLGGQSDLNSDEKNSCQENRRRARRSQARIKDTEAFWNAKPRQTAKLERWFQRGDGESKDLWDLGRGGGWNRAQRTDRGNDGGGGGVTERGA